MKKEIEELNKIIVENDGYQNSYETDLSEMHSTIKVYFIYNNLINNLNIKIKILIYSFNIKI